MPSTTPTTPTTAPDAQPAGARSRLARISFSARLLLVGILAVAVRVVYIVVVRHRTDIGFDAQWFHDVANGIADGVGFRNPVFPGSGATAHWPPGYPGLLSLVSLAGGRSLFAQRLVGALTGGVSVVAIGLVGRRVAGERLGLRAAAIACFWPTLIAADGALMAETLALPLVLGMVLVTYRLRTDPRLRVFALLGVAGAAATYARSDAALLFVLLLAVALFSARASWRTTAARAAVAVAVLLALLAPWVVRNTVAFDRPTTISTDLGGAAEGANCPLTYHGRLLGFWTLACVTHPKFGENEALGDERSLRNALDYASRHVLRLPEIAGVRLLRTWGLFPTRAQLQWESLETRWEPWQLFAWIVSLAGLPLAAIGLVVLRRQRAPIAPLLACIVGVSITSVLVYGIQRFRIPAEPALIMGIAACSLHVGPFRRDRVPAGRGPDAGPPGVMAS